MGWVSKLVRDLRMNDNPRCMRCGRPLDGVEIEELQDKGGYPCCDMCWPDVNAEHALNRSMWPNDWYGHGWQDCDGNWHVELEQ